MRFDIDLVESAWLSGSSDWDDFIEQFDQGFMAPVEERMQRILWENMPEQQKQLFKLERPEDYAVIEQQMKLQEV